MMELTVHMTENILFYFKISRINDARQKNTLTTHNIILPSAPRRVVAI